MKKKKRQHWTLKDKLEVGEAVCTIVVSIMALWGTLSALNHHLFSKATHLIEHYHREIEVADRQESPGPK